MSTAAKAKSSPNPSVQELDDALTVYDRLSLKERTYIGDYSIAHNAVHKIYHSLRKLDQRNTQSQVHGYLRRKSALNNKLDIGRVMMGASREIVIETRVQMKELKDQVRER